MSCSKTPSEFIGPLINLLYKFCYNISPTLHRFGVSPNFISILGFFSGLASIYYLWKGNDPFLTVGFFIFYYLMDTLDGCYARRYNMCSKLGAFLDQTGNLIVNTILMMVIIFKAYTRSPLLALGIILVLGFLSLMSCRYSSCIETLSGAPPAYLFDMLGTQCPYTKEDPRLPIYLRKAKYWDEILFISVLVVLYFLSL